MIKECYDIYKLEFQKFYESVDKYRVFYMENLTDETWNKIFEL
jgi:hypothetical protein